MALLLLIETGTAVCSVALVHHSQVLGCRENTDGRAHAQVLAPFIADILHEQHITAAELDAVAVSEGPGSYTGLRVGVSTAKGICYAAQKPLIAVNSLLSLARLAIDKSEPLPANCLIAPMIDARRMEVYTALFDTQGRQVADIEAKIIDTHSFFEILEKQPILFIGDGAEKCRSLLQHPHALFADIAASAVGMITPATRAFAQGQFVDPAYFEPLYLKDFVVTSSQKKTF